MILQLQFLPAADGDAIWIRWGETLSHQLLIDMGREATGKAIRKRLQGLPPHRRSFELLVVTHVDGDHIGGVLSGLVDAGPLEGLRFDDVWFNGWPHLHGKTAPRPGGGGPDGLEPMGPVQGERLTDWLTGPWNERFNRGPVERSSSPVQLPGDLRLTILGPTRSRLERLRPKWKTEVAKAVEEGRLPARDSGLERLGPKPVEPELRSWTDLHELADSISDADSSEANATSICLLLEWKRRRVLLTGDAWAPDVVDGLNALGEPLPIALDVVKAPHHGSEANLSDELLDVISCPTWVLSTSGIRHYHPDAAAIARILRRHRRPRPQLVFNVPSEYNRWWENPEWKRRFDYATTTGGEPEGIVLTLEPA